MQGDALLVTYMRDVASVLQLRSLSTGVLVRELPMPGYGSVKEVCGRQSLSEMYYSFESMTDAGSTYKCTLLSLCAILKPFIHHRSHVKITPLP